jgi:arsenate reductase-like glutaredoxin family protein
MDKNIYKFPDETDEDKETLELDLEVDEDKVEIEVVDDTPPQDRGRKPLDREVADPTDEELNEYSKKVQTRMRELTHKSHDERRKAEALYREKTELERAAQALAAENKRLQEYVQVGQHAYIDKSKSLAQIAMDNAKAKFKSALDIGDTEAATAAQQEMMTAQMEMEQVNNFKPTPLREPEQPAYTQATSNTQAPQTSLDDRVVNWASSNPWFERRGDEDMTGYAYGVHNKLVREYGQEYTRTDEYFKKIDNAMRRAFPERFDDIEEEPEEKPQKQNRPKTVVASAQRSSAPKKIRLSLTQQNVAKRLGIPLELYAKKLAELENSNG